MKAFAEELKALAEATQVLQSETGGAEGQMYSLFQESSSVGSESSTVLAGSEVVAVVRRLRQGRTLCRARSARLAHFRNLKFGAGTGEDPFAK